jgi:tetratricopeptide (TPR) repeat protein
MRRWPPLSALIVALALGTQLASAQKDRKEPRRPKLPAGADTNSAQVYYDYGLEKLERDPEEAANAFYWATRLDPIAADAYYARRTALLMADPYRLRRYMSGDRRTIQSDEIKRIDSLYWYSRTINPFLYRKLDLVLVRSYISNLVEEYARRNNVSANEVQYEIDREMMTSAPASFRAERAYSEGRFDDALRYFADAIKAEHDNGEYRAERGQLFFQLNQADSALSELTQALEQMRKADKKDLVYVYESKALMEHSIGLVQQRLGNAAAAKEAFARALQEDLSYFPAHIQLGYMALEAKDTTMALSEMDLAVQIRDDDPSLRYIYGYALEASGKHKEAEQQLRKSIEFDPIFASPYLALGHALDGEGRPNDAVPQYQAFLAHASQQDLRRAEAQERITTLTAKGGQ